MTRCRIIEERRLHYSICLAVNRLPTLLSFWHTCVVHVRPTYHFSSYEITPVFLTLGCLEFWFWLWLVEALKALHSMVLLRFPPSTSSIKC